MEIKVNNKKFIVTDMIIVGTDTNKYNVFDETYNHVCTIDAKNDIEFASKFNDYLIEVNYELE